MIVGVKEIDLSQVAEQSGVDLTRRGSRWVGLCPFHTEKTPSFFIFGNNRFKCFGCGESGDCIDFVMKLHGLSFPEALKHLGIEQGRPKKKARVDLQRGKRRAELVKQFRDWEQRYGWVVGDRIFKIETLMDKGIPPQDLELYAPLFHELTIALYHQDILINGSDKQKFLLFQEAQKCRMKNSI